MSEARRPKRELGRSSVLRMGGEGDEVGEAKVVLGHPYSQGGGWSRWGANGRARSRGMARRWPAGAAGVGMGSSALYGRGSVMRRDGQDTKATTWGTRGRLSDASGMTRWLGNGAGMDARHVCGRQGPRGGTGAQERQGRDGPCPGGFGGVLKSEV